MDTRTKSKSSSTSCFGKTKTKEVVIVNGVESWRETVTKRDGTMIETTSNWEGRSGTVTLVVSTSLSTDRADDGRYPPEARTRP